MSFIKQAFHAAIENAKAPEQWYVALMEESQYYGGPEEGGWWGTDTHLVAFAEFQREDDARNAAKDVQELAEELEAECRKEHGKQCLREMEWLEARGLDADFLPKPDGPTTYHVVVSNGLPRERFGSRHYE